MQNLSNRVFIRPSEIQEIYGISKSTAYRQMAKNKFPQLISLSTRCVGWRKEDLDNHFNSIGNNATNDDNFNL